MKNKKAQIFSVYLMVLTGVMCALVIWLYLIQQENVESSLVSSRAVLETRDDFEKLEKLEKKLILESLEETIKEVSFESNAFSVNFLDVFLEKINSNEEVKEILFTNLVHEQEARENERDFIESIYSVEKDETGVFLTRANIEKKILLKGDDKTKINFRVGFSYVLGKKYLIILEDSDFNVEEI